MLARNLLRDIQKVTRQNIPTEERRGDRAARVAGRRDENRERPRVLRAPQGGRAAQDLLQLLAVLAQGLELLLDLDGLQPGQLAQANLQNVFGLAVA